MIRRPEQLQWSRSLVIALSLLCVPALTEFSFAEQAAVVPYAPGNYPPPVSDQSQSPTTPGPVQPAEPAMPSEPAIAPEFVPPEETSLTAAYLSSIGRSMDIAHASLERNILLQTVRFDNFFGDVHSDNLRQTTYELRWRNSFRVEHAWDVTYGTSVRAKFVLSRISERLRLVIAGEDDPGQTRQTLPQDPGNPGFDRTTPTAHFANTELRYELVQKPALNIFLGAGVRITLPFEAFLRSRFQYTSHLDDVTLMRVAETFFVKNTDLLGETTEFSLERLFGARTIIRWASAGTASEEIEGVEWGTELSLLRELSPKSAITLTGGVYGVTSTAGLVSNYRLLARYRRNFLREWLFFELEPEVTWPRESSGVYPPTYAFTFRFEVVFQGASAGSGATGGRPASAGPGK